MPLRGFQFTPKPNPVSNVDGDTVLEEAEASSCVSIILAGVVGPQHCLELLRHEQFSVRYTHFGLSEVFL